MKNQEKYTQDCLRTWKSPNVNPILDVSVFDTNDFTIIHEVEKIVKAAINYEEIAHIIAGISSEILSELEPAFAKRDSINILEEIGDIQYYVLIAAAKYDVNLTEVNSETLVKYSDGQTAKFCVDSPFKAVKYHAGELINLIKKIEIYKSQKVSLQDIKNAIIDLQASIYRLCHKNGFTPSEAIERVIEKLKKRYAEKFTVSEADTRDLDAEYKALEGEKSSNI